MLGSTTGKRARGILIVILVMFAGGTLVGIIGNQLGLFPRLDSPKTQQQAGDVKAAAQELLREQGVPEKGEWELYSMSKNWSKIGGPLDGGSFRYSIDGNESHLITVEWELQEGERLITLITSTNADEALYEIRSD